MAKRSSYVEPFSMKTRTFVGSVQTRYHNGEYVPAVNVKPPLLYRRLPAELQADHLESIRNDAYEMVAEQWWSDTPDYCADKCFKSAFKNCTWSTSAAGRSNGWVVVYGLGVTHDWKAKQHRAWACFEKAIKKSMLDAEKMWHDEIRERM